MKTNGSITFEEGCNLYLQNCKERNLRDDTIRHYRQSYLRFYKHFDRDMPLSEMNERKYKEYVLRLREEIENDVSINSYLRDLIATMRFLMEEGYVTPFKMKSIKVDQWTVETYTDEELRILLKKPDLKKCGFMDYQCWVMTNFVFSTGVRQRSLIFIQIKDVDFDNSVLHVRVTKNRKPLIIPISSTMLGILKEYLKHRQHKSKEDYLFCNAYGEQLCKTTSYNEFVRTEEFAHEIQKTDNYYVIATRASLFMLPYSVNEVYGIRNTTSKYIISIAVDRIHGYFSILIIDN